MACEQPITAYRATHRGGPVTFKRPQAHTYEELKLPCGTCILCRTEQARQQAIRISHEAQMHERSAFVTMTYNDEHLPLHNSLSGEGDRDDYPYPWQPEKDRRHLSDFWKRVRFYLWEKHRLRLRYYAVGEYGDRSHRPHYHACIFGHDFLDGAIEIQAPPRRLWTSPLLTELWGKGNVAIGALSFETARYTASYVQKKLRSKQKYVRLEESTGELVPLVQPKAFMSRNLGKTWWDKYHHQVIAHDRVIINGRPQKPPKAYDRWLKDRSKEAADIISNVRTERAEKITAQETHARALEAHARAKSKSKSI